MERTDIIWFKNNHMIEKYTAYTIKMFCFYLFFIFAGSEGV